MTKRGALARPRGKQRWGTILTIVACGVVAALQVGKAAIAAPALQSDLGLDLAQIGAVAGIFSVLGFVGSIPAGLVIATTTARSVLLWGLLAIALGAGQGRCAIVSRAVGNAGTGGPRLPAGDGGRTYAAGA